MEERNNDIEKWLQEAAARQEQEQTAPAEKREAWDAMLGMLDQPAVPPRRFRWKFWMGGALLLGIVIYFMLPEAEKRMTENAVVDEKKGPDRGKDQLQMNGKEEAKDGLKTNEGIVPNREKDKARTDAGAEMNEGKVNGKERLGENKAKVDAGAEMNEGKAIANEREGLEKNKHKAKANEGLMADDEKDKAKTEKTVYSGKHDPRLNGNKRSGEEINKVSADGKEAVDVRKNNPGLNEHKKPDEAKNNLKAHNPVSNNNTGLVRAEQSSKHNRGTTVAGETGESRAQASQANPAFSRVPPTTSSAQTVPWQTSSMAHLKTFNITLPPASSTPRPIAEPDAALSRSPSGIPDKPVTHSAKSYAASGFSVRVGGIMPLNNTYGANIAAEYTFSFFNRLRLRPYAGAAYLAGFNKPYQHTAFYTRPFGPGTGTGRIFIIDSIVTDFQATSLWFGEGGLQVAYAHKRWELMAGIGYQHVFRANGTADSTFKTWYDSLHAPNYQPELFSKGTLPGVGKLILQAGVNYMITPQLQGGVRYSLQLQASRGGRGYGFNPQSGGWIDNVSGYEPALPLQSSLEVQVRWYFRRKKE